MRNGVDDRRVQLPQVGVGEFERFDMVEVLVDQVRMVSQRHQQHSFAQGHDAARAFDHR